MEEELFYAYLAGCIDCDGCISIQEREGYKICTINLTQHDVYKQGIEEIVDDLLKYGYKFSYTNRVAWAEHSDTIMLNITVKERRSLIQLIPRLIPHLRFKKEKAKEMLEYLVDRDEKRPIIKGRVDTQEKRRYWKDEEHAEMLRLHSEGYSNAGIGKILNRSRESIGHRLCRHGITRNA